MIRPGSIYRRLETDEEFRRRLGLVSAQHLYGVLLDAWAWEHCGKKQRRIVEVGREAA